MKAGLVIMAIKVRTPQPQHGFVIPPDEEADGTLEEVRANDKGPELGSKNILGRKFHQGRNIIPLVVHIMTTNEIDRQQDAQSQDGEDKEDIPQHALEAQENDSI